MAAAKPRCFFDLIVNGEREGRVLIELLYDKVPLAAENFRSLCTGEKGINSDGVRLHYKGTKLYVKKGEYISGGSIGIEDNCSSFIPERDFSINHDKWVVSITPIEDAEDFGEIYSMFKIVMKEEGLGNLNFKDLAIGKVVRGKGLLNEMDSTTEIRIFECGQLYLHEDAGVLNFFRDGDDYPDIADLELHPDDTKLWESAVSSLCCIGEKHFQEIFFKIALKKYTKALSYVQEMENMNYEAVTQISLNAVKSIIWTKLSECKLGLADNDGALEDCNKALKYNGANLLSLKLKGQIFESMGDLRQALTYFRLVYSVRGAKLQSLYGETRKKVSITLESLPALIESLASIANVDCDKLTIMDTKNGALAAVNHLYAAIEAMNKEIDETKTNDDGLRDLIENIENRLS